MSGKRGSWICFGGRADGISCWVEWDVGGWEVSGGSESFSPEATGQAGSLCAEMGKMGKGAGLGVLSGKV